MAIKNSFRTLADALNEPRRGRKSGADWYANHIAKSELEAIILSLMDNNGPEMLTEREREIVNQLGAKR